ncbi:YihY/virulence factor BrkB family protein [Flavobacterium beibuense]|uniref:Putative ribonuclease BN n=1 Tax=Flavobacterium beibuense TaxID=657326 RepID=A0A444WF43_9FLAO|nr:YihY/virulence factor BrkB family protein [Flavobacterium beibuense]RYJ44425.1 putative ribonuclease BN [Flavobacterium beibuense]
MKIKYGATKVWTLLKTTFSEFNNDNAIKLAASLSYYTIFSIAPLSIIIISICGLVFGEDAVRGEFYGQINEFVGSKAAAQIQEAITNTKLSGDNIFSLIVGLVILLIGASGVFVEIQSSINYIWELRAKPDKGLKKFIQNRLMSFSMIGVIGFLLMVSLLANTLLDVLNERLHSLLSDSTVYLVYVLNFVVVFIIITLLFSVIFRTLPDGYVKWKDTFVGSATTAILFMVGKFGISLYLGSSNVATAFGAAGSIIIILVWVYYSAIILYFGAEFTKVYARLYGKKITPKPYAVKIRKEIVEV